MPELTFEYLGEPLTHQKIVPGDTVTGIGSEIHRYVERDLAYTSGGTTEIVAGDTIVGATSAATAVVISVTLASGTWAAGTAAGTLRVKSQVGNFASENIKVEAGTNDATIAANSIVAPEIPIRQAKAALITVETNNANMGLGGVKPSQTYGAGHRLVATQSAIITDINAIRSAKFVDTVSGSASTIKVTCFF